LFNSTPTAFTFIWCSTGVLLNISSSVPADEKEAGECIGTIRVDLRRVPAQRVHAASLLILFLPLA
jgi:hypothetical protein